MDSLSTHKCIGLAIGVLSILVSCVVMYGDGGTIIPEKPFQKHYRMTEEEKAKGDYENFVPIIARFHFLAGFCWLYAVYFEKKVFMFASFAWWVGNLLLAALCAYSYFYEGKPRKFGEREVYVMAGTAYWICSLIVAAIWFVTWKEPELPRVNESELLPMKQTGPSV